MQVTQEVLKQNVKTQLLLTNRKVALQVKGTPPVQQWIGMTQAGTGHTHDYVQV